MMPCGPEGHCWCASDKRTGSKLRITDVVLDTKQAVNKQLAHLARERSNPQFTQDVEQAA